MNLVILLLAVTIGVVSAQYGGGAPGPAYPAPVAGPSIPWGPPFHHHRYRSWSRSDSRSHSRRRNRSRSRSRSSEEKCHKCKKLGLYSGPSPVRYFDPTIRYEMKDGCWQAVASCPFDGKVWILGGFANKAAKDSNFIIGGAISLQRVITCTDEKEWEATELRTQKKVQIKYVTCVLLQNVNVSVFDQVPTSVIIPALPDLSGDPTVTPTIVAPSEPTQPTAAPVTTSSAGTTGPGTSTGTTTGATTPAVTGTTTGGTTSAATVSTTGTTTPAATVSTTGTTTPAATVLTTGTTTPATTTASTTAAALQKSAARTQGPVATTTLPVDETPDNGQAEREYQALLREAGLLD